MDIKSLLNLLAALVSEVLWSVYTGIQIQTNPENQFSLILGGKQIFHQNLATHLIDRSVCIEDTQS